jgi:glycosidase
MSHTHVARRPARRIGALLALALALPLPLRAAPDVERVEPPNWWVGMREPVVQLMVHGEGIADATPVLDDPRARIVASTRLSSPNYLFVDLAIATDATPGTLQLGFRRGGEETRVPWTLEARRPGSALREGFGPRDAILNLMPDRFANGDPSNDSVEGMAERADRSAPSGRHGGDLAGIADRLDYIQAMGWTMVWPTPVLENNQPAYSYHGYSVTDLYRVDPRIGNNDQYRALVAALRARGMGMIMDIVPNHIGSGHWWMRDLPSTDWITQRATFVPTRHQRTAIGDPYAAQVDRDDFTAGWFVDTMPDLNQRVPQLATYLVQNTIWWIEYADLSGLRIDTFGYSDTDFIGDWSRRIMAEYPRFAMVGEEWSGNPAVVARWQAGKAGAGRQSTAMPNMMDFPLNEALRRGLSKPDGMNAGLNELYQALFGDLQYPDPFRLVVFEGNHDVPRIWSVLGEDLALWRMAMLHVATIRGIPQFYYGTEVLMDSPTERDDAATRKDFPGGWRGDRADAVTGRGLTPTQREAQAFLRALLNWRRTEPLLHHGRLMHFLPRDGVYAWFRYDDHGALMMAINRNDRPTTVDPAWLRERLAGAVTAEDALSGARYDLTRPFELPARSANALRITYAPGRPDRPAESQRP